MRTLALTLFIVACCFACTARRAERPALIDAARSGDAESIRALLALGADPDQPSGRSNWTPLLHAVHTNHPAAAAALLDGGADVDRAAEGVTPLMMAAGYGNRAMVALLLQRGADPLLVDRYGLTALDRALTGVADVDALTLFRCQNDVVALLTLVSPPPHRLSERWARLKGC